MGLRTESRTTWLTPASNEVGVPALGRPALRSHSAYRLRFAESPEDRRAAYRLRFLVFNLELNEGLESAYRDGYDVDEFDAVCDHLIVEHAPSGEIIGTYRLQTGAVAARNFGYYSSREFEFAPYERFRAQIVELGRAAIHRDHRCFDVLTLLWHGIADYAKERNARYLLGCSSLSSQKPEEGSALYWSLQNFLAEPRLRTKPLPRTAFPLLAANGSRAQIKTPRLLRAYLSMGARICGEPAMDRDFATIDFLTLLDLQELAPAARSRFLR